MLGGEHSLEEFSTAEYLGHAARARISASVGDAAKHGVRSE